MTPRTMRSPVWVSVRVSDTQRARRGPRPTSTRRPWRGAVFDSGAARTPAASTGGAPRPSRTGRPGRTARRRALGVVGELASLDEHVDDVTDQQRRSRTITRRKATTGRSPALNARLAHDRHQEDRHRRVGRPATQPAPRASVRVGSHRLIRNAQASASAASAATRRVEQPRRRRSRGPRRPARTSPMKPTARSR